ncbi:MAG: diguanylate cyclase [Paracoccaceae bacterium]
MTDDLALTNILQALCPMHARLDRTGHIRSCGDTLRKFRPGMDLVGKRFLEVFDLDRPRRVTSMADMLSLTGAKLHLQFREPPLTSMIGAAVAMPDGGVVMNLSPGISVIEAVRDYALTGTDFAATDLTVELLFLVEANAAAMEASRHLNLKLQGAKIAAEEQAFTDTLTGLKNRRALDHVLSRQRTNEACYALMHLDLDYFKSVNDTLGHAAGDLVLQKVAQRMVKETRENDTVARVGGDEFVLILSNIDDRTRLGSIARRLIARLEEPVMYGNEECRISASIGITLSNERDDDDIEQMIADADAALYAAKAAGRGCFRFFGMQDGESEVLFSDGVIPANEGLAPDTNKSGGRERRL